MFIVYLILIIFLLFYIFLIVNSIIWLKNRNITNINDKIIKYIIYTDLFIFIIILLIIIYLFSYDKKIKFIS
jgi:hypothetical protein